MTDPIIPDRIADELLAGRADPAEIAAELRGVAELTAAAHQAPTEGELAGMTAAVAAFQAVVAAPASAAGASSPRSVSHMISTRLPKRAAIISAVTVVLAGTAAAAAAGAVPSFGSPSVGEEPAITTVEGETTTTLADAGTTTIETSTTTTDPSTTTTEASTSTTEGSTSTSEATDSSVALYPGRDYGLCTAWTNGAPKRITNPAFSYLVDQAIADAAAATPPADEAATRAAVDAYCDKVIADKKSTSDDTDDDATEPSEPTEVTTATSVDHTTPAPSNGNGKGNGNGNGKGHGKP